MDFSISYGMFDDENLVGFILHCTGISNGKRVVFNTGTGVVPKYRGQRIVDLMYEFGFKDLTSKRFESIQLEVIKENAKAIHIYEKLGFKKQRELKCFSGEIQVSDDHPFELHPIQLKTVEWDSLPHQDLYSWDNLKDAVCRNNFQVYYVQHEKVNESYFILDPKSAYVAQLDMFSESILAWKRLFLAIKSICPKIKINNIDSRLLSKLQAVHDAGLVNSVNQLEMYKSLSSD
ncbi:MAG: GNAT family N-acetyltransferase [Flavobacteriales bacterium]|nr:GNAT family N-acetyltransferase [Flavobacteriales bacterium]